MDFNKLLTYVEENKAEHLAKTLAQNKVDRIVMPLTFKKVKVRKYGEVVERANIYDRCGFVVAEVENDHVAEEIVAIINKYNALAQECEEFLRKKGIYIP